MYDHSQDLEIGVATVHDAGTKGTHLKNPVSKVVVSVSREAHSSNMLATAG